MSGNPFFSVVLPTYGRGRHIRPSVESVLAQTYGDLELIVVGDGCADETEAVVRSFPAERVHWRNLPHNTGSQSFPNNEGIGAARGRWIAYIGHDDIWAPNHLERIAGTIASDATLDFVISGCVFHGPLGSDDYYITGLFDEPDAGSRCMFPPTSLAHRRDVIARMGGGWRDPRAVKPPADNEFLLRAAHAGLRFASTGEVTVHKFAAGHRYLSYLRPSSDEQREFLRNLLLPTGVDVDAIVRKSKANGQFMVYEYGDYSGHPDGYLFEQNRKRKGISLPALQPLRRRALIKQTDEPRGLDWRHLEGHGKGYRWSGPNPKPKILLSYSGGRARLSIEVIDKNPALRREDVSLYVEGRPVQCDVRIGRDGVFYLIADIALQQADYTVLTLDAPTFRHKQAGRGEDQGKSGLAVGRILLQAMQPRSHTQWPWRRSRVTAFLQAILK
ncbi:MAG TPA: glycosyltransferase family A protein [Xanthobacteraceae bacterium]|nr:glycosyltransferase family A protein [Xanthobacteraceae bacterium]